MNTISTRADVITRRTYNRPLDEAGTQFESWEQTVSRVINHQKWLWERAKGIELSNKEKHELNELKDLILSRKICTSGRTLWLGGTEVGQSREASMFNCAFTRVETIEDVVDVFWLLLQGCGVGFSPVTGTLSGFRKRINSVQSTPSTRDKKGGRERNTEEYADSTWTISIGDSAESWAKSIGKLLAGKFTADTLILDFSQIRPEGERLKGYGWISSGYKPLEKCYLEIVKILNRRAGQLLTRIDILDIINHLGTCLSTRRSAEICLMDYGVHEWKEFATAKNDLVNHPHRQQSNNSLVFYDKPSREELTNIFDLMIKSGGSEPGFINGKAAIKRAPWYKGFNPCGEIILPNKGFCNLVEVDVSKFKDDFEGLLKAIKLIARANYRQTLVNLDDGILQKAWDYNNKFLRLCGVGLTGITKRPDLKEYDYKIIKNIAVQGAYSMADELGTERPKNVTTIKPSGTISKIMDTTEGVHKPLGKYIFNNVNFSKFDPVVRELQEAGYRYIPNPFDPTGVIITFPVKYDDVPFDIVDGKEVNLDSATSQLERYKVIMENYCEQNCSVTISYDKGEKDSIINWLLDNWDIYVGVSFIFRNDPTKTAKDLGYSYLPQEVVTEEEYNMYTNTLKPVNLNKATGIYDIDNDECESGVCPVK